MQRLLCLILALIFIFGCATIENWSDKEKQTAAIVAGLVVGAIIIAEADGDKIINEFKEECRALPHGICD